MVVMQVDRPTQAMTAERAHPLDGQIRTGATRSPDYPVRLTRRGRIVVAAMSALIIGLLSVVLATAAQATRSASGAGATGKYVTKVVVRPGQSLWTVAEEYDPNADPRLVIADIQQMNSMTGDQLQAGEALWVPRG